MISLKQLAEHFMTRLNDALNNPEIEFVIYPDAGEHAPPARSGNTVVCPIEGTLTVQSSANDANNALTLGVNGLDLEIMVPLLPPRTNATQTAEDLQKIKDDSYPFVTYIRNAINSVFSKAYVGTMTDNAQNEYTISYQAGIAPTDNVDIYAKYGNAMPLSVYIQLSYIEGGGVSGLSVQLYLDKTKRVPFQSLRFGRSSVIDRDVFSGTDKSTVFQSSTAFSIDVDFPSVQNKYGTIATADEFVFDGATNTAHFVSLQGLGDEPKIYFMTMATATCSAQGTAFIGNSVSFAEVTTTDAIFNVPEGYQVTEFTFPASTTDPDSPVTLSFNVSIVDNSPTAYLFIPGLPPVEVADNSAQSFELPPAAFSGPDDNGNYIVKVVTDTPCEFQTAPAPYKIVFPAYETQRKTETRKLALGGVNTPRAQRINIHDAVAGSEVAETVVKVSVSGYDGTFTNSGQASQNFTTDGFTIQTTIVSNAPRNINVTVGVLPKQAKFAYGQATIEVEYLALAEKRLWQITRIR